MLTIRLQRGGRSGHPQYRVVVQDSRFSPTSGRIVAQVGSFDPHSKATTLDKEQIEKFMSNGAQPSERVASMLAKEGVKLPSWVKPVRTRSSSTRNAGKLRRNTPEAPVEEAVSAETEAVEDATVSEEAPAEETAAEAVAEAPAE
jgi:small subunit ribosomal protein S16